MIALLDGKRLFDQIKSIIVYRIYVRFAYGFPGEEYLRWKFVGTYVNLKPYRNIHCARVALVGPDGENPEITARFLAADTIMGSMGQLKMGYRFNPRTQEPEFVQGLECTCVAVG